MSSQLRSGLQPHYLQEIPVGRIVIGTLNINSLASKFDQLEIIIRGSLDILIIQETKLDSSFPDDQFVINGYKKPYRLDRNRHGWGHDGIYITKGRHPQ